MLPTINGKSLLDCSLEDFQQILGNPDYRENEYIDYKESVSILNYPGNKTDERQKAIAEFRSDVCSFANASGGYLVFGISEDGKGVPKKIEGILIDNTDQFERKVKDWLSPVNPRRPNISFNYIMLEKGSYIVVLGIQHDSFCPYIHLENGHDYRVYKRYGNSKVPVAYSEMRKLFTQSIVLEKEIEQFRNERIDFYYSQADSFDSNYARFMILHIIPETFLDISYNQPLFALERKQHPFGLVFTQFRCSGSSVPMVEGLRYPGTQGESEGRLFNNGIAEFYYSLSTFLNCDSTNHKRAILPWVGIWDIIEKSIHGYVNKLKGVFPFNKLYVGFSIIGCKDIRTVTLDTRGYDGKVDRDKLIMNSIVFEDINEENNYNRAIKLLKLDYQLSLGIKPNREEWDIE